MEQQILFIRSMTPCATRNFATASRFSKLANMKHAGCPIVLQSYAIETVPKRTNSIAKEILKSFFGVTALAEHVWCHMRLVLRSITIYD